MIRVRCRIAEREKHDLRTHSHGQGYTDLNFIIPDLISRVDYWKGPHYSEIGDFASAGGAHMYMRAPNSATLLRASLVASTTWRGGVGSSTR